MPISYDATSEVLRFLSKETSRLFENADFLRRCPPSEVVRYLSEETSGSLEYEDSYDGVRLSKVVRFLSKETSSSLLENSDFLRRCPPIGSREVSVGREFIVPKCRFLTPPHQRS